MGKRKPGILEKILCKKGMRTWETSVPSLFGFSLTSTGYSQTCFLRAGPEGPSASTARRGSPADARLCQHFCLDYFFGPETLILFYYIFFFKLMCFLELSYRKRGIYACFLGFLYKTNSISLKYVK